MMGEDREGLELHGVERFKLFTCERGPAGVAAKDRAGELDVVAWAVERVDVEGLVVDADAGVIEAESFALVSPAQEVFGGVVVDEFFEASGERPALSDERGDHGVFGRAAAFVEVVVADGHLEGGPDTCEVVADVLKVTRASLAVAVDGMHPEPAVGVDETGELNHEVAATVRGQARVLKALLDEGIEAFVVVDPEEVWLGGCRQRTKCGHRCAPCVAAGLQSLTKFATFPNLPF